jgi:hypothetical protein
MTIIFVCTLLHATSCLLRCGVHLPQWNAIFCDLQPFLIWGLVGMVFNFQAHSTSHVGMVAGV